MLARHRILATCGLFALWMTLLLTGWWVAGGWVHGLLLASLAMLPWRELGPGDSAKTPPTP